MQIVSTPVFQSFLSKDMDIFSATAIFLIITSINLILECKFLLIYLSYFIIAHYIKLIHVEKEDDELPVPFSERYTPISVIEYA
jgi:hypothetical protein